MRKFLLPMAVLCLSATAYARDGRSVPKQAEGGMLPADFVTQAMPGYGQAEAPDSISPAARKQKASIGPKRAINAWNVRPSQGTFVDEPDLPLLTAYNFTYPYTFMGIEEPDMEYTHILDGNNWPPTCYLREGNVEGTYFQGNPSGYVLQNISYNLNGLENWSKYSSIPIADLVKRPLRVAYDPREDRVYALSQTGEDKSSPYALISYHPRNLENVTVINSNLPWDAYCNAFCWDPRTGNPTGVNRQGDLITFDKTTGEYTTILSTGIAMDNTFFAGLAYSPDHNGFIWATLISANGSTKSSDFYLLDPENLTFSLMKSLPMTEEGLKQISALMVNKQYTNPTGPRTVEVQKDTFLPHQGTGSLELLLPWQRENATGITRKVKVVVRLDGTDPETGASYAVLENQAPGGVATVDFTDLPEGLHRIGIWVVDNEGEWSRSTNVVKYVGYDTPEPTRNVTLTQSELTWAPVTRGLHGQDISGDGIHYEVWVDGVMVEETTQTSCAMDFDPDELFSHLAAVYVVNNGKRSFPMYSNRVTVGNSRTLPATYLPDASDVLLATCVDVDGDNNTWRYDEYYEGWVKYYKEISDDWLFLAPVNFDDPDALYKVSFELQTQSAGSAEVELTLSGSADPASAQRLITAKTNSYERDRKSQVFTTVFPASGIKHLGFHTLDTECSVAVRKVTVEKTGSDHSAPAAPADLEVYAGNGGSLTSQAMFTAPSVDMEGNPLTASSVKVEITSPDGLFDASSWSGAPGAQGVIYFTTPNGWADVCVQSIADGKQGGMTRRSYWAGQDVPGVVRNVTVGLKESPMEVGIKWDPLGTEGLHGGYADPSTLGYCLMLKRPGASKWSKYSPVDYTEMVFTINPGMEQELVQWGIMAENAQGVSNQWDKFGITCGTAYTLPMRETLPGGFPYYNPVTVETPTDEYTGSAGYADPSQIKPEYAVPGDRVIGMMPPAGGLPGKAQITLPLFSTEGMEKASVHMHTLLDPEVVAEADLYAFTYGKKVKIGSWGPSTPGLGYTSLTFPLPTEMMGRKWVQLAVDATFPGGENRRFVVIQGYTVSPDHDDDLGFLSVTAPDYLPVGKPVTVNAVVCNNSLTAKACPKVTLNVTEASGTVGTVEMTPAKTDDIAPDCERLFSFTFTPTADMLGEISFALSLPDDEVSDNNASAMAGSVVAGDIPLCTSLTATRRADEPGCVDLAWEQPYIFDGTESMEGMNPFDTGKHLGAFLNIDMDGKQTYSWENWDFPHEEEPHAFIVFDQTYEGIPEASRGVLRAHSGDKFLLALAPLNYVTASDWLISPEVAPGSEVGFWVATLSAAYGADQIGLYVSEGSTDPADFQMLTYLRKKTTDWEEVTATMPEGAKRFAIRFYSNDTFGILIDDISYTPADGLATLEGFEVERDGESIHRIHTVADGHTDTTAQPCEHRYRVTPWLLKGSSLIAGSPSPTAVVPAASSLQGARTDVRVYTSGRLIVVEGADPAQVSATDMAGLTLCKQTSAVGRTTFRADSGVYVVNVHGVPYKVSVR